MSLPQGVGMNRANQGHSWVFWHYFLHGRGDESELSEPCLNDGIPSSFFVGMNRWSLWVQWRAGISLPLWSWDESVLRHACASHLLVLLPP